jgi:hypothetical protein
LALHVLICAPALAASVAELVDALDSKSSAERRAGSIPAGGTTYSSVVVPQSPRNRVSPSGNAVFLCAKV